MSASLTHLFSHHRSNNHKPKLIHIEGLVFLIVVAIATSGLTSIFSRHLGPFPAVLGFSSSIVANDVVVQTNNRRSQAGLGALRVNPNLVTAAASKGNDMCAQQYWAHISPSGTTPWVFMKNAGYTYSVAGENLARDFAETGSMMDAWMASPTHKANILHAKYAEIGIAVVNCHLLGTDTTLVVSMFGSQSIGRAGGSVNAPSVVRAGTVKSVTIDDTTVAGQESAPSVLIAADPSLVLPTASDSSEAKPISVFTPVQFQKAFFIAILSLISLVLVIDMWLVEERKIVRISSRSLGHFLFLSGILIVVLIVKAGAIL